MDGTVGYKPAESSGAKWLAIINPSAAGGSAAAEWPLIDRLLRRAGITAEAVFTAHRYHAVELTVAAVNDGIRHIIAVGGDTTLHEVVNGLFIQRAVRPEEITLGIIPTGNCRIAGIPKTYPEAVWAIASGYVSLYHIATVSYSQSHYRQERLMAGEAGMGLYAMLAARFNQLQGKGKATVPRRLWAVLESILSYRAPQVRIYADGQSVYCGRAAGATLVISGEFPEGHFELTLQPGGCRMTCLRLFYKLFRGKPYDLPGSLHWRGRDTHRNGQYFRRGSRRRPARRHPARIPDNGSCRQTGTPRPSNRQNGRGRALRTDTNAPYSIFRATHVRLSKRKKPGKDSRKWQPQKGSPQQTSLSSPENAPSPETVPDREASRPISCHQTATTSARPSAAAIHFFCTVLVTFKPDIIFLNR